MNSEEVDDELRLAGELLAQLGSCVATPTGQVFRWQTRIMMQPDHDERRGREAELLGAEQRGDHDVAAGLQLAVGLHDDAVAQAVQHERPAASRRGRAPTARRRA
jgi:hypothetical protein